MLERVTVGGAEPLDCLIYVPEDCHDIMPVPEWGNFWSRVDDSVNPVLVSDLDQEVLMELIAEDRGLTFLDLKKRSEYSWSPLQVVSADEQRSPPLSTLLVVAGIHLSEIASAIPPVDPDLLTVKHSAFLALAVY